jgi:hypothetical protein
MPANPANYLARKPRHPAIPARGLQIRIERSAGNKPREVEAELADFSRHGIGLITALPLYLGEAVTVRLDQDASDLRLLLSATVRWQRHGDPGWSVGCQFQSPLDLATLGELFLNNILDAPG